MPRIGLRALGVSLNGVQNVTIKEIFGDGVISVPEFNKRLWKFIKDKNLKVKLQVGVKKSAAV